MQGGVGKFVMIAGVSKGDGGLIEFLAWEGALLVELLTAVVNLLFRFQRYLGRLRITLRLLDLLGQSGGGRKRISGLGLIVSSLVVLSGRGQGAVFLCRGQLAFMKLAAAAPQERFYRCADLWNNR